jgi:hypothetical protein
MEPDAMTDEAWALWDASILWLNPPPLEMVETDRVTSGLIVYYPITDISNGIIEDLSGVEPALDLTITGEGVEAIDGRNGIKITASSDIRTAEPPMRLYNAITATNEFTLEVLCAPASVTQSGPARIVSYSENPTSRNFTLGPQGTELHMRIRTSDSSISNNGLPESKALDVVTLDESHFVITNTFVDNVSTVKFYKNGEVVATDTRAGDFSNWDSSHVLLLANEATGDRPWLGEIYMVAIYDRPLSEEEVKQNFDAMQ